MTRNDTLGPFEFWPTVNAALDSREDPLEIASVQEWIAEHPADGDELARLLRHIDAVGRARAGIGGKRKRLAGALLIGTAALAIAAVFFAVRRPALPPDGAGVSRDATSPGGAVRGGAQDDSLPHDSPRGALSQPESARIDPAAGTETAQAGASTHVPAFVHDSGPPTAHAHGSRVLHYALEIVREDAASRSTVVLGPGRLARHHASRLGATTIVTSLEGRLP